MPVRLTLAAVAAIATLLGALPAGAQQSHTLKLASFAPPGASSGMLFERYAKELKEKSGGRLILQNYHGASMGPMPRHFDLARTGVADLAYFQHGATPGRFPLTELLHLPYMVRDSEMAVRIFFDLLKGPLGEEHKSVHVLWLTSSQTAGVFHASKPIRTIADLKGQRLRAPTTAVVGMLKSLGAVPIGVPANLMAESLQKGTLDGVITDSNGVFSFKLGNLVKYETPLFRAVLTFGLVMNQKSYDALPPDLRRLVDGIGGLDGAIRAAKSAWTENPLWVEYIKKEGVQHVDLPPQAEAELRKQADAYAQTRVAELEKKGLPAARVYAQMKELAVKYAK